MLVLCFREDKSALNKLVEAVRTNYNDRYDEVSLYNHVQIILSFFKYHLKLLCLFCNDVRISSPEYKVLIHIIYELFKSEQNKHKYL